MINNSIFDPMKQIWINLGLYFERYEFANFKGLFCIFFEFKIDLFNLKSIL